MRNLFYTLFPLVTSVYFYPMIVLRPKASTLFSLSLFTSLCLVAGAVGITHYLLNGTLSWYDYIFVLLLLPLGVILLLRLIFNYSSVRMGKDRITVIHPTRFSERNYSLSDIEYWTEKQVKTPSGLYKEVEIRFSDRRKVSLSLQEHKGYPQAIAYLQKKCKRQFKPAE